MSSSRTCNLEHCSSFFRFLLAPDRLLRDYLLCAGPAGAHSDLQERKRKPREIQRWDVKVQANKNPCTKPHLARTLLSFVPRRTDRSFGAISISLARNNACCRHWLVLNARTQPLMSVHPWPLLSMHGLESCSAEAENRQQEVAVSLGAQWQATCPSSSCFIIICSLYS